MLECLCRYADEHAVEGNDEQNQATDNDDGEDLCLPQVLRTDEKLQVGRTSCGATTPIVHDRQPTNTKQNSEQRDASTFCTPAEFGFWEFYSSSSSSLSRLLRLSGTGSSSQKQDNEYVIRQSGKMATEEMATTSGCGLPDDAENNDNGSFLVSSKNTVFYIIANMTWS